MELDSGSRLIQSREGTGSNQPQRALGLRHRAHQPERTQDPEYKSLHLVLAGAGGGQLTCRFLWNDSILSWTIPRSVLKSAMGRNLGNLEFQSGK